MDDSLFGLCVHNIIICIIISPCGVCHEVNIFDDLFERLRACFAFPPFQNCVKSTT